MHNPFDVTSTLDYGVFRKGFQPDYEAAVYKNGGRVVIGIDETERQNHKSCMELYTNILALCIGETFHQYNSDKIFGVRLVIKPKNAKIELWCTEDDEKILGPLISAKKDALERINHQIRGRLLFSPFDEKKSKYEFKIDKGVESVGYN